MEVRKMTSYITLWALLCVPLVWADPHQDESGKHFEELEREERKHAEEMAREERKRHEEMQREAEKERHPD